ncbi:MAG: cytochrome c peroxidase [Myxococcota bacterium]|jgi:cytochrome c peroxidase|nr:cytochrome c peroxidase [Myxococcota bacterium]
MNTKASARETLALRVLSIVLLTGLALGLVSACANDGMGLSSLTAKARSAADVDALRHQAAAIFGALPSQISNPANGLTDAKIDLGRQLYYDERLSKNHDIACNSCHLLDNFGQDSEPTSPGHRGQRGGRNSPTVYNAAGHVAQFWDGRAPDVEAQAQGPVLNPIEMAMPSEAAVLTVLKSIPGYVEQFPQAFPGEEPALTYANMARAIGAFERRLMTPGRFDAFVEGDPNALSSAELDGLELFIQTGCPTCHMGSTFGGTLYQKLGAMKPYPTNDQGRFDVTGNESDRFVFKVPSLRNIAETGPYFHDGSVGSLEQAVSIMAEHQLAKTLTPEQNASIRTFLEALTGEVDEAYIAMPVLPASGPTTPAPNPN